MAKIPLERLAAYDNNFLLTTDEVCAIVDLSPTTISKHRHAGLLPFVPGRPIRHRVADVKVYAKLLWEGFRNRVHRTLVIDYKDRAIYSPLSSVHNFTDDKASATIEAVIKETDMLWKKYKMQQAAEKETTTKTKRKNAA